MPFVDKYPLSVILDCLSDYPDGVTVKQLAERLNITDNTVRRKLCILVSQGVLEMTPSHTTRKLSAHPFIPATRNEYTTNPAIYKIKDVS